MSVVVKASHVYKVFGKREHEVVKRLEQGEDRDDLTKLGTAAVIDASFEVEEGEIFVVMGLSGSGKSTLIRTLNGLWTPTAGSVEVLGTDIARVDSATLRKARSEHISMVFQHFALLPHRTVRDNAAYALEIRGVPRAEREEAADRWRKAVGLEGWGDMVREQRAGGRQERVRRAVAPPPPPRHPRRPAHRRGPPRPGPCSPAWGAGRARRTPERTGADHRRRPPRPHCGHVPRRSERCDAQRAHRAGRHA